MKNIFLLMFLLSFLGCEAENKPVPKNKFYRGQLVQHKTGGPKGVVVHVKYIDDAPLAGRNYGYILESWVYIVRFKTDKTIGVDTAAGSGLGHTQHYQPTLHITEELYEWELQ